VVRALIAHGHLATVAAVNPVNRCPQWVLTGEEVEGFGKRYLSLFALAKQQRKHFRAVKKELEAAGVKPTFDPETVGATFYGRSDCQSALRVPKLVRMRRSCRRKIYDDDQSGATRQRLPRRRALGRD
jgi:hypothetical protein